MADKTQKVFPQCTVEIWPGNCNKTHPAQWAKKISLKEKSWIFWSFLEGVIFPLKWDIFGTFQDFSGLFWPFWGIYGKIGIFGQFFGTFWANLGQFWKILGHA